MKSLLVLSILLFSAGCGYYGQPDPTVVHLQTQSNNLSEERAQLEVEGKNLDTEKQQIVTECNDYFEKEQNFALSLDDHQLDAYGQMMLAFKDDSSNTAIVIASMRKLANLIPPEKYEEFQQLVKNHDEIVERAVELQERIKAHDQQLENYNIRFAGLRQDVRDYNAYERQRSLMRKRMAFDSLQQSSQQWHERQLYGYGQPRIYQSPQNTTYWQEQLAREQWNEKWSEKFKIHPTPLIPAPIIYPK